MTNETTTTKHVLIVEDDPDFAALLRSYLAEAGYSVATAYNCDDGLSQVRERTPDLITLDIQMPGKSGVFFYRKLKSYEEYRDIPVVVVTGLTRDDRDMENVIRSFLEPEKLPPPEAYVEKPVDQSRFLDIIRETLAARACVSC